jgi:hypothetical protein
MFSLAVILHETPQTSGAWPYVLLVLGALLILAILAGLWWAERHLPPEMDDGQGE